MKFSSEQQRKAVFAQLGCARSHISEKCADFARLRRERFNTQDECDTISNVSKENKFSYAPIYAVGDIPALGVDIAGTAGAATIAAVPLVTGLGILYVGSDMLLKTKERLQKQYKEEGRKAKTYSQRLIEKEKTVKKKNRYSIRPSDLGYYDWGANEI